MKLLLIRHGKTSANERRLYCGKTDVSLCENGRAELLKLCDSGLYRKYSDRLKVTSGMKRTDETMRILFGCEPDRRMKDLQEIDFGRFEMHSYDELKNDADYQAWICDKSGDVLTPGGESSNIFHQRVYSAIREIQQDAVVICHGGVIAALMAAWFPDECKNMYQWQSDFGLGYDVDFQGDEIKWENIAISRSF